MKFLVILLCVILALGCVGLSVYFRRVRRKRKPAGICIALACASVLLMILAAPSVHMVEAGEIAVVKVWGKAEYTRQAGTYFDFWVSNQYEVYDAKVQNLDIDSTAYSKDAQTMDITMTVQYKINPEYALEIATQYGNLSLLENRVNTSCIEKAKSILSKYSAMEIIENRASISPEVERTILATIADTYYVDIVTVVLTDISFSDAFENTVEDKMIAEQEKLKAEYEKEKAIIEAEKELEVAKLQAQAKIAAAEGDAESRVELARAEAEEIKLKSIEVARMLGFAILESEIDVEEEDDEGQTVTTKVTVYDIDFSGKTPEEIQLISEYLKYVEYLSVWNGELPGVMMDGGSGTVMIPQPQP